jgi:hypothetical protein
MTMFDSILQQRISEESYVTDTSPWSPYSNWALRTEDRALRLPTPADRRPVRGGEEAMQYYQLTILCALRDKIAENERGCRSGIASGGG